MFGTKILRSSVICGKGTTRKTSFCVQHFTILYCGVDGNIDMPCHCQMLLLLVLVMVVLLLL
jgi:hypothetical protein